MSGTRWRARAIPAIQMLSAASVLTRAEWVVFLYAWLLFPPFAVLLRLISFKRLAVRRTASMDRSVRLPPSREAPASAEASAGLPAERPPKGGRYDRCEMSSRDRLTGTLSGLSPARVAQLVAAAAQFSPVRPSCLVQALVLQRLIGGQAHDGTVVIGAMRQGESIAAHAWVEAPGQILLGGVRAADYRAILRLPLARPGFVTRPTRYEAGCATHEAGR